MARLGPSRSTALLFVLGSAGATLAQQPSPSYLPQQNRPASFSEQIEDPAERKAFERMFRKQAPTERRASAEDFLDHFPQSWYRAQAYEIAAKACIDLGDQTCAIQAGRESLRLLPENPLLLVPLANVEATSGDTGSAIGNAQDALEMLERFSRPRIFSEKEWADQKNALRVSSYYVLGRALSAEALKATGSVQAQKLRQAERYLEAGARLDPGDDRIAYILGLTRLAQQKSAEAAVAFAAAYGQPGPFQQKLREHLARLYQVLPQAGRPTFEQWVKQLQEAGKREPQRAAQDLRTPRSAYAGSSSCRECHAKHYAGWEQTGHARMFAPYRFENVIGDFKDQSFKDDQGQVAARMTISKNQHYFQVRGPQMEWQTYRVDYTIGSKWQQTYATRLPNGEIHVFPLQYNVLQHRWVPFWKQIDPPGAPRGEVGNFFRHSPDTAYMTNCAPCHTSQLRKAGAGPASPSNAVFREGGINCEACHGPAQAHVDSMRAARPGEKAPLEILQFSEIGARDYVAICAQCHMQSAERGPGPDGEANYRQSGDTFFPRYVSTQYSDFMRRAFYKDGRFRVVSFIVESFVRTACYRKGNARCGHCHEMHPADARTNDKGLRPEFLSDPDGMCLQCHPSYAKDIEAHTHHRPDSTGSRCVACHMPKIQTTVLFKAMTHQIDDIPRADTAARFGPQDSPNACLLCHTEKDAKWLQPIEAKWYPKISATKNSSW